MILASDANPKLYNYAREYNIEYAETKRRLGFSSNFNNAVLKAKGNYVKVLADDDRIPSNSIQCLFDKIKNTNHALVHGNATDFKKNSSISKFKPSVVDPSVSQLLKKNPLHGGTIMYNKKAFTDAGMYDTFLLFSEEYEMYLRLKSKGYTFTYVDKFVYLYRRHGHQKSTQFREPKERTKNLIINRYELQ